MHKPSKWPKKWVDNNCSKSGKGCKICDMFGYCRPYNWRRKLYIIWETAGPVLHQDLERGRSVQGFFHTFLWMSRNLWKLLPDLSIHSQLQHSWRWIMCSCNTKSECTMEKSSPCPKEFHLQQMRIKTSLSLFMSRVWICAWWKNIEWWIQCRGPQKVNEGSFRTEAIILRERQLAPFA